MGEFKLERIRYTWKGDWSNDTEYLADDIVNYSGSSYVCFVKHTSGNFLEQISQGIWRKMTEGKTWLGDWESSVEYNVGSIVAYGGVVYICVEAHQATAFQSDINKWAIYASGINWTADWTEDQIYKVGDIVRYGGTVYQCVVEHLSQGTQDDPGTLESDQSKWKIIFQGNEYLGNWQIGTPYKVGDLVKFGGSVYRCKQAHTPTDDSTINFDQVSYWDIEFPGFQYRSIWNASTTYRIGDVVRHGGWLYYSLTDNFNSRPINSIYELETRTDPLDWAIISKGIRFLGDWSVSQNYITGDVVRRGGDLYVALLDTVATEDGSSLDYLDTSNWELITVGQRWRNFWTENTLYQVNDIVIYLGSAYRANVEHISTLRDFPGDNGSGVAFWDLLLPVGTDAGLIASGDLLTYNLSREVVGDGSTIGPTRIPIADQGALLYSNDQGNSVYHNYGEVSRVFYVSSNGVDDEEPRRGISPYLTFKTVRYACERADDGFSGFTTIKVSSGIYDEVLPIIVPARTVVLGTELRTTTINAAPAIPALANDSSYTISALGRISQIIQAVFSGAEIVPAISAGNKLSPVRVLAPSLVSFDPPRFDENDDEIFDVQQSPVPVPPAAAAAVQSLINDITLYIDFYINSAGAAPTVISTNTATTTENFQNAVATLEANKDFLAQEAVSFVKQAFPEYDFDEELCKRDIRRYIDAWKYDITFTGNYKSLLAARYYRNAILGSESEDMFYCRDATGVRNCTLTGLQGVLGPLTSADRYRTPTGGAYISLDPGWGPADNRTWILTRSPYIQGVTTFGTGCVGQKIDGALHNGGNRSIVSNDFTQVLSDGIGAWVTNNGRAELVSVFTYYAHVGYLAKDGGKIRATNGNNSYGGFGSVADGVDATEIPITGKVTTRNQEAIVKSVFAGDFVDEIQILEWGNAGQNYTEATASIVGAGINAEVVFEEFRDDAVFESRILDTSDSIAQILGGRGYTLVGNNAQEGDETTIVLASNDTNPESFYLGMRIVLTSGPGTGQYGYINAYNEVSKVAQIYRESNDEPGWDHVVPGKIPANLTTATTYRVEPRVIFSAPEFSTTESVIGFSTNWGAIGYGETTQEYLNVSGTAGTGNTDLGIDPSSARFNVIKKGRKYEVTPVYNLTGVPESGSGAGYNIRDEIVIKGGQLGGIDGANDLIITVTSTTNDSTNAVRNFTFRGVGGSGKFVVLQQNGTAGLYSFNGINWPDGFNLPVSADWISIANGNNMFVAVANESDIAISSMDGLVWTQRTLPEVRRWNSVIYGQGIFFAVSRDGNSAAQSIDGITWTSVTMPNAGDSSENEWVGTAYGKKMFIVVSGGTNLVAKGIYNNTTNSWSWNWYVMDVIEDSSLKNWVGMAYGNNRFVSIARQGDVSYSFDGEEWYPAAMPTKNNLQPYNWTNIKYAQGVFFAIANNGPGNTNVAATSYDGIVWQIRQLSTAASWKDLAFGNPYIELLDSTVGKNTPMWVIMPTDSNRFSNVRTGARAIGRAVVGGGGSITDLKIWDPGSGYQNQPTITIVDPNSVLDARFENRLGDGVLTNPSWINRGFGYRTLTTAVNISGDGFADIIPQGKFISINNLTRYPGPGALMIRSDTLQEFVIITIEPLGIVDGSLTAFLRVSPEIKNRDNILHETPLIIREKYSQCRITGHDFLDIGTGNFEQTNYPDLYATGIFTPAPENETLQEDGGRVFYTSTDQDGNFRVGELFQVEQSTGIVTISADFFELGGLTELSLGGIRIGGTGTVIREFSVDPAFSADSNNIVPTQRAIRAYLQGRLSVGGSEISVGSFIAGTVLVGPNRIGNVAGLPVIFNRRADFNRPNSGIRGSLLAQYMFFRSFK